jgi:hypothetical protein
MSRGLIGPDRNSLAAKGGVMSRRTSPRLALTGAVLAVILSWSAWPQQKHPITISSEGMKSRYVQQLAIDVDDMPGHQVRVQESQRIFPAEKGPLIDDERIVESWSRSLTNYTGGIGPAWGYNTLITDKGSKIFLETVGTSESQATETGSKRGTYHGTAKFIGGTGRFAKIRGLLVDVARFDTDPKSGYSLLDSHGEYWFEQ